MTSAKFTSPEFKVFKNGVYKCSFDAKSKAPETRLWANSGKLEQFHLPCVILINIYLPRAFFRKPRG